MPGLPFRRKKNSSTSDDILASEATQPVDILLQGRRYRQDIPYIMPNDLQELNRLDFQHYLLKQAARSNYAAPLAHQPVGTILDVGCGSGKWAIEMAEEFPQAQVTALDIELPLAAHDKKLTNMQFLQANVLRGIPFHNRSFNYVHQRFLNLAVPEKSWPHVLADLVRVTAVGGHLEIVELLPHVEPEGEAGKKMNGWVTQLCAMKGIYPAMPDNILPLLKKIPSISDAKIFYLDLPTGNWGARDASLLAKNHLTAYAALKPIMIDQLHISAYEFDQVTTLLPKEWDATHASTRCAFIIAQKMGQ